MPSRRAATVVEELERQCLDWTNLPETNRPIKIAHATGNGCVAFALRFPAAFFVGERWRAAREYVPDAREYVPDADGSIVSALVVLFKDGKKFGWKGMGELAGPYSSVSASILKHLSALNLDSESARSAQRWRDDCRAYSAQSGWRPSP